MCLAVTAVGLSLIACGSPVLQRLADMGESGLALRQSPESAGDSAPHAGSAETTPRDVSDVRLFDLVPSTAAYDYEYVPPTVEELVEKGMFAAGESPVHIAVRGTANTGSARCDWYGVARTLAQREETIRFLLHLENDAELPSAAEVERIFDAFGSAWAPAFARR